MFNDSKSRLVLSEITRVILSYLILFFTNIPIFIKIILIISLEYLDCAPKFGGFGPLYSPNTDICRTLYYQQIDKVTDIICYFLILVFIFKTNNLSNIWIDIILILFTIRLIGTYLFIISDYSKYLFYFPNFFLEFTLGLVIICYYPILKKHQYLILGLIIILKMIQEYYLHIYKK